MVAQRIRTFTEGQFSPSPPPQVLRRLTDGLLVTACDTVKGVAAEAPPLSGNSALRLLAWTIADARGATSVMDKPLALTVGKRLDRQAQSVRAQLQGIRTRAEEDRIRYPDDGDATKARQRGVVDHAERKDLELVREEEYVGFHELDDLSPVADEPTSLAGHASPGFRSPPTLPPVTPGSATTRSAPLSPHTAWDQELRSIGCWFPWQLVERFKEENQTDYFAVPPDLANALGPAATKAMREDLGLCTYRGADWWQFGVARFAKRLLSDREELQNDLTDIRKYLDRVDSYVERNGHALKEVTAEYEALRQELEESRRREAQLTLELRTAQEVIRRRASGQ